MGNEGEAGVAQLVDLLITTQGPLPGAKLVEWNMADPAGQPGSAGMWEVSQNKLQPRNLWHLN